MSRRNLIKNLLDEQLAAANSPAAPSSETHQTPSRDRALAGPVRTMSLTLDKIEEESRALQQALATGAAVVELDPSLIDGSFARDRLAEEEDQLDLLKASLRDHGQTVPILVRPHPDREGRYQAAYGHRRLKAARDLGVKIKAVVRALTDEQLVSAQGIENSARRDLSFIERAFFAKTLEDGGFGRPVVMAALSTEKTELSKMISVARALPEAIVKAIGPAPKGGRRRWIYLAELLKDRDAARRVEAVLSAPDLPADSDARFLKALAAAENKPKPASETITTGDGVPLARVKREPDATTLRFNGAVAPHFADFVMERLADLYAEFRMRQS